MVRAGGACFGAALLLLTACRPAETRLILQSQRDPARAAAFAEQFAEAWFSTNQRDRWDVVLRDVRPSERDPDTSIEQIVHLRMFWRPRPGTTHAESSQTDALITYAILDPISSVAYEGAGFVYLSVSRDGRQVTGSIESASLRPQRRAGAPRDPFGPSRLSGTFIATRNDGRAAELQARIGERLGAKPEYHPPEKSPDPR